MDERTLTALKGSIAKWEAIVAGTGADNGGLNCPLCKEFDPNPVLDDESEITPCGGCPVAEKAGDTGCRGTPYQAWSRLFMMAFPYGASTDEQRAAAQAELDFLRSLLPTEAA